MNHHHLSIRRSARLVTIGEMGAALRDVWIVCHGYGQLARSFAKHFVALERADRLIVAPEALNKYYLEAAPQARSADARVGATWMTKEDRETEIADYVAYLDQAADWALTSADRAKVKLTVLGFSQAVTTVSRWIALGRTRPDRLVLWAGELPHDLDHAKFASAIDGVDVVLVAGDADQYATPERVDAAETLLRTFTTRVEVIRFVGAHVLDAPTLESLAQ